MTRALLLLALAVVACAAPLFVYPVLLMTVLCFVVFACSFNLLLGYAGLLCFGHAMFFGGGAYITGYVLKSSSVPVEVGILRVPLRPQLSAMWWAWSRCGAAVSSSP